MTEPERSRQVARELVRDRARLLASKARLRRMRSKAKGTARVDWRDFTEQALAQLVNGQPADLDLS